MGYTIRFKTTVRIENEHGDIVDSWDAEEAAPLDDSFVVGYGERGYGDQTEEDEADQEDDQ